MDNTYTLPFRDGNSPHTGNIRVVNLDIGRSVLVLGETGSGKTEAIRLMTYQFINYIKNTNGGPIVVFDYKDDYKRFFENIATGFETKVVAIDQNQSDVTWNIFEEVESMAEFEEIGRILFKQYEEQSRNPFFPQAARQVFVSLLKGFYEHHDTPVNLDILATLNKCDAEELHQKLTDGGYIAEASHIDPAARKQSAGVFSNLQMVVSELLKGNFGSSGEFSIRRYMSDPGTEVLILDFPLDRGETVKPVYRFYIDWAIRHALGATDSPAFFILDEFQTIPGLEKIERLVNAGRAQNAYGILGLQSVSQLNSTYGEASAQSILSGLAQEVLLRPGDSASINHIRTRMGREIVERDVAEPDDTYDRDLEGKLEQTPDTVTITDEEYPISEADLQTFQAGEAIVITKEGNTRGRLWQLDPILQKPRLSNLREVIEQGRQ